MGKAVTMGLSDQCKAVFTSELRKNTKQERQYVSQVARHAPHALNEWHNKMIQWQALQLRRMRGDAWQMQVVWQKYPPNEPVAWQTWHHIGTSQADWYTQVSWRMWQHNPSGPVYWQTQVSWQMCPHNQHQSALWQTLQQPHQPAARQSVQRAATQPGMWQTPQQRQQQQPVDRQQIWQRQNRGDRSHNPRIPSKL